MSRKFALPLLVFAVLLCLLPIFQRGDPTDSSSARLEAEAPGEPIIYWTEASDCGTLSLREHGEAEWVLVLERDGVEENVARFERNEYIRITGAQALDDLLGFPGFRVETVVNDFQIVEDYYALTDAGLAYAGNAFGVAGELKTAVFDLDGDGRNELVAGVQFLADGAELLYVYRWNGKNSGFIAQPGEIDWDKALPQSKDEIRIGGYGSHAETYDPEENTVTLHWYDEASDDVKTATLPLTEEILRWNEEETAANWAVDWERSRL